MGIRLSFNLHLVGFDWVVMWILWDSIEVGLASCVFGLVVYLDLMGFNWVFVWITWDSIGALLGSCGNRWGF